MRRFDYVEIGAADFDTVLQRASRLGVRGVTVEPVRYYLDRLPDIEGCVKVQAAVGMVPGAVCAHYLEPEIIKARELEPWLRGCSCIGVDHPLVVEAVKAEGLDPATAIRRERVDQLTFAMLVDQAEIGEIGLLKIDAEGMDLEILQSWLDASLANPGLLARVVMAETSSFNRRKDERFLRLRASMEDRGYRTGLGDGNNVIWRR